MLLSHPGYLLNNEAIAIPTVTLIRDRNRPTSFCSPQPHRRESRTRSPENGLELLTPQDFVITI
jgi:hypothetical protein